MEAKDLLRHVLQIQRSSSEGRYGDMSLVLKDLEEVQVTAEQLETSDIVRVLYGILRRCPDNGVKRRTKSLLRRWRRSYRTWTEVSCRDHEELEGGGSSGGKVEEVEKPGEEEASSVQVKNVPQSPPIPAETSSSSSSCSSSTTISSSSVRSRCVHLLLSAGKEVSVDEEASSSEVKDVPQSPPVPAETSSSSSSSVRSRCVHLLLSALSPDPPDEDRAKHLATDIEHHVHALHPSNQLKYKSCIRSKVSNLRNPKSPHLREDLLSGSLSPRVFAAMTAEEMAGEELRRLRAELRSRAVSERQLPQGPEGTRTRRVRCQRCGGTDCRVTQVSRGALFLPAWVRRGGADEDAMTFMTCNGCGQQWYHSGWVCL